MLKIVRLPLVTVKDALALQLSNYYAHFINIYLQIADLKSNFDFHALEILHR
jgi:hypothetical protein